MNKQIKHLFLGLALILWSSGCVRERSVIESQSVTDALKGRIEQRGHWLPDLESLDLTANEQDALSFLYAYMPLGDVADYDVNFYLTNIRATLLARKEMAWGNLVPEREFLHFVLPVRVNNENMDTSRVAFYAELAPRLAGLSIKDAILEVNHWCDQKASYTPSDSRTISPGCIVANGAGRCGEQSTFTVAALRSVGIPARQVYVDRWAHTDDNHAWVEAWATDADGLNGQWYYLGACEPEPVLNTGWFDSPATRSLVMSTKVFGHYLSDDPVMVRTDNFTQINLTERYAPTACGVVVVRDSLGGRVAAAQVTFSIYNYASFHPVMTVLSDNLGEAQMIAGLGDMVVFASKDGRFASGVLDLRRCQDTLFLTLDSLPIEAFDLDIIPPSEGDVSVMVSEQQRVTNDIRSARQDSILRTHVATFANKEGAERLAREIGVDSARVWNYLCDARGNHNEIATFLLNTPKESLDVALDLLSVLSQKDLTDTPASVLTDHLIGSLPYAGDSLFVGSILNARIDEELITAYRSKLSEVGVKSAAELIALAGQITIDTVHNSANLAISPLGVHRLKMGDKRSVERYLIALLRSNGIAAKRDAHSGAVRYFDQGVWKSVAEAETPSGKLRVSYRKGLASGDPKLNTHFTIAKWNGTSYLTIDLQRGDFDMGSGQSYRTFFESPVVLPIGRYVLISGTRLADGAVLSRVSPFTIQEDRQCDIELVMRSTENSLEVIGSINPETKYVAGGQNIASTLMSTTGRGYFILALIDASREPTTHLLRDLSKQREILDSWGRPIVVMLRDSIEFGSFDQNRIGPLPSALSFGYDCNGATFDMLSRSMEVKNMGRLPVVVVADTFGRVVYLSTGYNISLGEQLAAIVGYL